MGAPIPAALSRLFTRERVVIEGRTHLYRWVLFRCRWFQIVVHNFVSDDPPDVHDHAWWNLSIVLAGALEETTLSKTPGWVHDFRVLRAGDIVFRRAAALHRLRVLRPAWTLFITGPETRDWGYQTRTGEWIPWRVYNIKRKRN